MFPSTKELQRWHSKLEMIFCAFPAIPPMNNFHLYQPKELFIYAHTNELAAPRNP